MFSSSYLSNVFYLLSLHCDLANNAETNIDKESMLNFGVASLQLQGVIKEWIKLQQTTSASLDDETKT